MHPVVSLLSNLIYLYSLVVMAWAILGILIYFKIVNAYQPLVYKLNLVLMRLVEPALKPIRTILPDLGGIDISPVILLLLLNFANGLLLYYF